MRARESQRNLRDHPVCAAGALFDALSCQNGRGDLTAVFSAGSQPVVYLQPYYAGVLLEPFVSSVISNLQLTFSTVMLCDAGVVRDKVTVFILLNMSHPQLKSLLF